MQYEAVIFDFDFTLADATDGIADSANYALSALGYPKCDTQKIRKTVGMTLTETFRDLTNSANDDDARSFTALFKERADVVMTAHTALLPGAIDCLLALKSHGTKIAIVTTKFHYRIDEVLLKFEITNLIDYIVGFEDVSAAKPSPEGLLHAIEYLGAEKAGVLYVGDSLIDANTALNAGVDFAAVTTGTTKSPAFEPLPHKIIAGSLAEIAAHILL